MHPSVNEVVLKRNHAFPEKNPKTFVRFDGGGGGGWWFDCGGDVFFVFLAKSSNLKEINNLYGI